MLKDWRNNRGRSKRKAHLPSIEGQHSAEPILYRGDENACTYFRCSRYFTVGHEWYAATREGLDVGPFADRHQAELGLAWFLANQQGKTLEEIEDLSDKDVREPTAVDILLHEFGTCLLELKRRSENGVYAWAKQRLDLLEDSPGEQGFCPIRAKAIRHFLSEIDR